MKEEEPLSIHKLDKDKKKSIEEKRKGRIRKSKRKGESEMEPNPRLPKNNSNKEIQIRKSGPLKCHNVHYVYKTKDTSYQKVGCM